MSESTSGYDLAHDYLRDAIHRFRRLKEMADKAIAQVQDHLYPPEAALDRTGHKPPDLALCPPRGADRLPGQALSVG